ncbi:F-box domain containing protein [Tanacetum coccineum]
MAEFSAEMIFFEILTRVPPKAVGRFKSVCKTCCTALRQTHDDFHKVLYRRRRDATLLSMCILGLMNPEKHSSPHYHQEYQPPVSMVHLVLCVWCSLFHCYGRSCWR